MRLKFKWGVQVIFTSGDVTETDVDAADNAWQHLAAEWNSYPSSLESLKFLFHLFSFFLFYLNKSGYKCRGGCLEGGGYGGLLACG